MPLRRQALVGSLREGRGCAVAVDHVGHFGQATAALRLAAARTVDGGWCHVTARCAQVAQGGVDLGLVQGIADANEQKISPDRTGGANPS